VTSQGTSTQVLCIVNCAHTSGDPHLVNLDSEYYDFQAVGEFIALKTDSGDLVVQVRSQPVAQSRTIAINQAAAISAAGDRVLVNISESRDLDVTVNGSALAATANLILPHDAQLARTPGELSVRLPDGSAALISVNPLGLDIRATLPDSRRTHVQGLLGPFGNAGGTPDLRSRDGTVFTNEQISNYDTLYRKYGDSWRITQSESLFSYGKGQTTGSFTDKSFPDHYEPGIPADRRSAAERVCGALNLPTAATAGCVMDVALTGDAGFAVSTALVSAPVSGNVAAGQTLTPTKPNQFGPGESVSGHLDARAPISYDLDVAKGTVAYFAAVSGCDATHAVRWTIQNVDHSQELGNSNTCSDIGRVAFPSAGHYTLTVDSPVNGAGDYRLRWIVSRADKQQSLPAGAEAAGTIDLPGATDVYNLDIAASTIAYFAAVPGCDATHALRWTIQNADHSQQLASSNTCSDLGRVAFPNAGHYTLRVYSPVSGTGNYRLRWIVSRPDRQLSLRAGAEAAGTIDLPGAIDSYDLDIAEGTSAYFAAAPGCDAKHALRWMIQNSDHSKVLGNSNICSDIGKVVFPGAGHYTLSVYSPDASTGNYRVSWKASGDK
jgi:hypothetical protein